MSELVLSPSAPQTHLIGNAVSSYVVPSAAPEVTGFSQPPPLAGSATPAASQDVAIQGAIRIQQIKWPSTSASGAPIYNLNLPRPCIAADPLSTITLRSHSYARFDLLVTFSTPFNPYVTGELLIYYLPPDNISIHVKNAESYPIHTFFRPNEVSTASLLIPFTHYRDYYSMQALSDGKESMGMIQVLVRSPLRSFEPITIPIVVSCAFKNVSYMAPCPAVNFQGPNDVLAEAVGQKTAEVATGLAAKFLAAADSALPMDNVSLNDGTLPTVPMLPSLASANTVRPSRSLQLSPSATFLKSGAYFDPSHTTIAYLTSRPFLLASQAWDTTQEAGANLFTCPINSFFDTAVYQPDLALTTKVIPPALSVLNMFDYWRADITVTVQAVRSIYHTGAIRFNLVYGPDPPTVINKFSNESIRKVGEFSGNESIVKFEIPWVCPSAFLETFKGRGASNSKLYSQLGMFWISVDTPLRATTEVSPEINLNITISLSNVVVAVPACFPRTTTNATIKFQSSPDPSSPVSVMSGPIMHPPSANPFPVTVDDITTLARRYVHILATHVKTGYCSIPDTNVVYDLVVYDIGAIEFPHTHYFAAWGGTIHIRLTAITGDPVYATTGIRHNRAYTDAFLPPFFPTDANFLSPDTNIKASGRPIWARPWETLTPLTNTNSWTDLTIPPHSIHNYFSVKPEAVNYPKSVLCVLLPRGGKVIAFAAAGDDLRAGHYAPRAIFPTRILVTPTSGTTSYNLGVTPGVSFVDDVVVYDADFAPEETD